MNETTASEHINAVQTMQDYIAQHLEAEISLDDLARQTHYSTWHAYRLFTELLQITPAVYIRRLRLSKSALRLRDSQVKILEVALTSGFDSVDGFQRAFRKEFGINPYEYSKAPTPIYLFKPYGIKNSKPKAGNEMNEIKSVFVQVVEKPKRRVIIKRGREATEYFKYCEEVGCDVWGLLSSIKSLGGEPVCLWLPANQIPVGTSEYVQGAEVAADYTGPIPEGFDVIDLPQSTYIQFQGEPFEEHNFGEAIQQLWVAISNFNPAAMGFEWDESNPRIQLEPVGSRGYIELHPVRPAK
ncbi:MAG: helix-turn-helix domain-containing protein [Micrococcales bacterium]